MKNIKSFIPKKYKSKKYKQQSENIYAINNAYVTSISFEQEEEYGEGSSAGCISQYPLEDLLDKYLVYVSDFYPDLNKKNSKVCYVEFASSDIVDIEKLLEIIDKHVYNEEVTKDDQTLIRLVIE